jgi:hypothetical protein
MFEMVTVRVSAIVCGHKDAIASTGCGIGLRVNRRGVRAPICAATS